ncbi:MAG: MbnP family copper-binding protein [Polyangiales bacterium]
MLHRTHRRGSLLFTLWLTLAACGDDDEPVETVPPGEQTPGDAATPSRDGSIDAAPSVDPPTNSAPLDASLLDANVQPDASPDAAIADAATSRRVTIRFRAEVNGEPFACGREYANTGATGATSTPSDFRFFVETLALVDGAGREVPVELETRGDWQIPGLGLIDFEDATGQCAASAGTNTELTGTVPAGEYVGLVFSNGIPEALNHGDPAQAPAPLRNAPGTLWSWRSGYKFILSSLAVPASTGVGLIHVGAGACTGDPVNGVAVTCARPNRNRVQLAGFDPERNVIVADLGVVLAQTDLTVNSQCHGGGMVCPSGFAALGIDHASGRAAESAPAFHVE